MYHYRKQDRSDLRFIVVMAAFGGTYLGLALAGVAKYCRASAVPHGIIYCGQPDDLEVTEETGNQNG